MYFCTKSKKSLDCTYLFMWVAWTEGDWLNEGADGNAQRYIVYAVSTSPHPIISQLLSYRILLPQALLWVFAQLSRFPSLFAGILTTVYSILHVYTPVYYSHKNLLLLNIIFRWSFLLYTSCRFKEKPHTTLLVHTMNYDTEYVCFHQTKEV